MSPSETQLVPKTMYTRYYVLFMINPIQEDIKGVEIMLTSNEIVAIL